MRGRRRASSDADASGADANVHGTVHMNACAKARAARRRRCATAPVACGERTAPYRQRRQRRRRVQQRHAHACVMNLKWTRHSSLAFHEMRVRLLELLSVRSSSSPLLPLSLLSSSYLTWSDVAWRLVDAAGIVPRIQRVRIDHTAACRHMHSWSGGNARTHGGGREAPAAAAATNRHSQMTHRHGWQQHRLRMLHACARPSRHQETARDAVRRCECAGRGRRGQRSAGGLHGASLSLPVVRRWRCVLTSRACAHRLSTHRFGLTLA